MKLAVIGLGLIGGSLALELRERRFVSKVMGVEAHPEHAEQALNLKLVDEIKSFEEACKEADLVVLAVPVGVIATLLPRVLDQIKKNAVVTDMGSTKAEICKKVSTHVLRKRFVPSHPMAGTEFSGPTAAHLGLFSKKAAVICDSQSVDPDALDCVVKMYQSLEMRLVYMNSDEHDLHAAYVSHLSHISSFVLANTVLDKEKNVDAIFNLASGGFESTVRLAKSSPSMWNPIFEQNRKYITEALGEYIERLRRFHESLSHEQFHETLGAMQQANEIKRVLAKMVSKKEGA